MIMMMMMSFLDNSEGCDAAQTLWKKNYKLEKICWLGESIGRYTLYILTHPSIQKTP